MDCVCRGGNKECRHCNGSGTVNHWLGAALTTHASHRALGQTAMEQVKRVPCPAGCRLQVEPDQVSRHLREMHGASTTAGTENKVVCRFCEVKVSGDGLVDHIWKEHSKGKGGAEFWWWICAAAKRGDAQAQCNFGDMFETGRGVRQDMADAVRWYSKAASQKHPRALSTLCRLYDSGYGRD